MQIKLKLPNPFAFRNPDVNIEPHLAALVAKLRQQATAYERLRDMQCEDAGPKEADAYRFAYNNATAAVQGALRHLGNIAHRAQVPPNQAVRALKTCVRDLQVAHLQRLRDDYVLVESDLKIASRAAYVETLGNKPDPALVQLTHRAHLRATRHVVIVEIARKRAESYADQDILDAVSAPPKLATYTKPKNSILKAPNTSPDKRKSVRWNDAATAFAKHVETATDYVSEAE